MTVESCKLAIFDLDGTLVELHRRPFVDALWRQCNDFRYEVTRRQLFIQCSKEDMFGFVAPIDRDWLEHVFWQQYAPRHSPEIRLPGALGALTRLQASGTRIAVATGRRCLDSEVRSALVAAGLLQLVDDVISADVNSRLDKPAMLRLLCQRAGCPPSAAVAIGDTTGDVRAARAVGIGCVVAVRSGHIQRAILDQSGPDLLLRSVADLPLYLTSSRTAA